MQGDVVIEARLAKHKIGAERAFVPSVTHSQMEQAKDVRPMPGDGGVVTSPK